VSSWGQSVNTQYQQYISSWVEGRGKDEASSWFSAVWFVVCTVCEICLWSQRRDVGKPVRWCHGVSHNSFPFSLCPVGHKWRL